MSWGPADELDRTAKIVIDSGKAANPEEAHGYLASLVLQVAVGPKIGWDPGAQAALASVVNAGSRAFKGGVHVQLASDPILRTGWTSGATASAIVRRFGGRVVPALANNRPTLVIGQHAGVKGEPVMHLTWSGWSAGVVMQAKEVPDIAGSPLAGALAAGLGISEAFQHALGGVYAGRRETGLSLWRPDLDWRSPAAPGPPMEYLPSALWLLGLGHLGQACAWTIGLLPYAAPQQCQVALLDFDTVDAGNLATQLLTRPRDFRKRKARVVACALERLGFRTRLVERGLDEHFRVVSHADPNRDEPLVALAGFDDVGPRRLLGKAGFRHIVDAGLGAGPSDYLDMVLHTFPAATDPSEAFLDGQVREPVLRPSYEAEVDRQMKAGVDETAARCGMLQIAGVTVGAAFVGATAATLAVADVLRVLHGGTSYSVIALDLREPHRVRAVINTKPGEHIPASTSMSPSIGAGGL